MTVKVSVVMATYNSGPGLRQVVAALQEQTMPADEFELVMVDDGSTDGTPDLAQELAATYDNVTALQIPASGWPGRPRNVGTRHARGEYVLYMDHDDDLFPEALERLYATAVRTDVDVLLGKEVVLGGGTPGWRTWRSNVDRVDRIDQRVLQCMTPHKLYRRQFLLDQQVWFPEGPVRLEDYNFNAQAYVRAQSIGIMADYPCYRWVIHETNAHKATFDHEIYWDSFVDSLRPVETELPPGELRDEFLERWYTSRLLQRLGPKYATYSVEHRQRLLRKGVDLLVHFPASLDERLPHADRLRSLLLRREAEDLLLALSERDRGTKLSVRGSRVEWRDGVLQLAATGRLVEAGGLPMRFRRRGERVLRVLDGELAQAFSDDDLDVTKQVQEAMVEVTVRGRTSGVEWQLPGRGAVVLHEDGEDLSLDFEIEAEIDPATAAMGRPLDDDVWDVAVRLDALGFTPHRHLALPKMTAQPAAVDGRTAIAYRTEPGNLALDLAESVRTFVGSSQPQPSDLVLSGEPDRRLELTLALDRPHVHGQTERVGTLTLGTMTFPARLHADETGCRVTSWAVLPPGQYDVRLAFTDRTANARLRIDVDEYGSATVGAGK